MYLKQTNRVANLQLPEDSYIRPQLSYFLHNDDDLWGKHADLGAPIRLTRGENLHYETQYVYYIKEGLLRFSRVVDRGLLPLFYLGRGTLCFEMHIIGHSAVPSEYKAIEECHLIRFPTQLLRQHVFKDPYISFALMESIGAKYSILLTRLNEVGSHKLERNVARLLLDMASYHRFQSIFSPCLCQRELTAFFRVHRSSINRAIAGLREKQIIGVYTKSKLEILDLSRLIEAASVSYV